MSHSDSDSLPDPDASEATGDVAVEELDSMIADLDTAIEAVNSKIESGRVRDPEKEKVRLKHYRTLGYLIRTKRKLVEDKTLAELSAEVEALRQERRDTAGSGSEGGSGSGEGSNEGESGEITLGNHGREG